MAECPYHGSCQSLLRECEQLRENDRILSTESNGIKERIVVTEQSTKSAHHRLDAMEEQTKAIIRMSMSVELMSAKMEEMITLYKDQNDRLDRLERAPGESVLNYWKMFIGAIVTACAGIAIGIVMKGGI